MSRREVCLFDQRCISHVQFSKMADVFDENLFEVFEQNEDSERKKKAKKRKKDDSTPPKAIETQKVVNKKDFKPDTTELRDLDYGDMGLDMQAKKAKVEETIERYRFGKL